MSAVEWDPDYDPTVVDVVLRELPAGPRRTELDYKGPVTVIHNGVEHNSIGWVVQETALSGPLAGETTWHGEADLAGCIPIGTHLYIIAGALRGVAIVDFSTSRKVSFQDATPA